MLIKTKIVSFHTANSKPVKQEVNGTVILPPLVFPGPRVRIQPPEKIVKKKDRFIDIKFVGPRYKTAQLSRRIVVAANLFLI